MYALSFFLHILINIFRNLNIFCINVDIHEMLLLQKKKGQGLNTVIPLCNSLMLVTLLFFLSILLNNFRNLVIFCMNIDKLLLLWKFFKLLNRAGVPQISKGFHATTNNYEQNIVQSIGPFTTKQFLTEKWKTERRMHKPLRLQPHSGRATHFRNKRSIGMQFQHAYAYLLFVSCVKVHRKCPNTLLVCNRLRMTA